MCWITVGVNNFNPFNTVYSKPYIYHILYTIQIYIRGSKRWIGWRWILNRFLLLLLIIIRKVSGTYTPFIHISAEGTPSVMRLEALFYNQCAVILNKHKYEFLMDIALINNLVWANEFFKDEFFYINHLNWIQYILAVW